MIISTIFRNRTTQKILRVVVPLAFWLGAWQLAAIWVDTVYTPGHGALLLPSPLLVWERLAALAARPSFWRTAAVSLGRIFGGFALGAAAGTLLAVITSALSWADWLFRPMVKVIRAVPVASFIVLVLLWASTGRVPAIVSGLMVLPVLWGNVCKGISQTDGQLLEAARAYRFGRWKTLRLVYVTSVLPYFASGCATGLGLAWKAEVAAEVLKETGMIDQTHTFSARWEGAVPVCADVGLTKQALRILVDNSIKYTPAGGHITLSAALRDGMARLSVQDEGQGIDAGSLPHVFDRFYRTDQSRARQTGGTGLGLAIAKWIVDRHGGWFEVRSWPGVGTRMTIVLPVAELDAGGADEDAEQTRPA